MPDHILLIQVVKEIGKIVAIAVVVLIFMLVAVLYMVLKLRWVIARIQSRLGPNRTGPVGRAADRRRRAQAVPERRHHPLRRGQVAVHHRARRWCLSRRIWSTS